LGQSLRPSLIRADETREGIVDDLTDTILAPDPQPKKPLDDGGGWRNSAWVMILDKYPLLLTDPDFYRCSAHGP
jgi:hypothetical protein